MKKALVLVFILSATIGFAQPPADRKADDRRPPKEKVEAMKIGFLTDRLDLSPEEAKNFWPIYNKYQDELDALRKSQRELIRDNPENMSDQEVEKAVDAFVTFRQNEVDVIKKYHPQFKKVLSSRKVGKLYRAEDEFKRELLERLRQRNGNQGGPNVRPKRRN